MQSLLQHTQSDGPEPLSHIHLGPRAVAGNDSRNAAEEEEGLEHNVETSANSVTRDGTG
jgi:hypothetical protein